MDFSNSFSVDASLPVVWQYLTDATKVAPCVPGAQLTEVVDATHFRGTLKVKLGPVQMTYRGELEMDAEEAERRITLTAKGTEMRGGGGANGHVVTRLQEGTDGTTDVAITTHVDVTGRAAQFGRGIMQDVSNRLIAQFAACLRETIGSAGDADQSVDVGGVSGESAPGLEPTETVRQDDVYSFPGATESTPSDAAGLPPSAAVSREPASQLPPVTVTASASSPGAGALDRPGAQRAVALGELRITDILVAILRARAATLLRRLADVIEPKD